MFLYPNSSCVKKKYYLIANNVFLIDFLSKSPYTKQDNIRRIMLTIEQIRSARAYLGWSQQELANRAGLSQTGLARIENGAHQPNSQTLTKIAQAFDEADIEFLGTTGLRKRSGDIKIYRGKDGARAFMDDVYITARDKGGKIYIFNGIPLLLQKWVGEKWYGMHAERMYGIRQQLDFRVIVKEGEKLFIGKRFAEYRYFPAELFNERMIYMYGNKIAFLTLSEGEARIVVLHQEEITDSFRVLFDISWEQVARPASLSQETGVGA